MMTSNATRMRGMTNFSSCQYSLTPDYMESVIILKLFTRNVNRNAVNFTIWKVSDPRQE